MKSLAYLYMKFDKSYTILDNGCWQWKNRTSAIYPQLGLESSRVSGNIELAHRFSYMIYKGDPKDFIVHHTCENKLCVNPDHLEIKIHERHISEHTRRKYCKYGHEIGTYNNRRYCKVCARRYDKAKYRQNQTPEIRTR